MTYRLFAILAVLGATPAFAQCYYAVVEPCAPVQPCEPVATCNEVVEPCAPVETCAPTTERVETIAKEVDQCLTGACPLRKVTSAAVKTAPVRAVANLLASANATRARYGLPALQYDASLTTGAQNQAAYCSQVGQLVHGGGCVEILAQNNQGLETALNQWLASPQHRALLLGDYRYAGVSVVRDRYGRSWCAMRFR